MGIERQDVPTSGEVVYEEIKSLIITQGLRPGERTSIAILAERLGRGKSPVKEAITRLASEGLLVVSQRRGTYVPRLERADIIELFEVRRMIEDYVAGHIDQASDESIDRAGKFFDAMAAAAKTDGSDDSAIVDFVDADVCFHETIVGSIGNRRLLRMYSSLELHIQVALYVIRWRGSFRLDREEEHRGILEAVRSRSAPKLRKMLDVHSSQVEDAILRSMRDSTA